MPTPLPLAKRKCPYAPVIALAAILLLLRRRPAMVQGRCESRSP